jgi:hypothetical protein
MTWARAMRMGRPSLGWALAVVSLTAALNARSASAQAPAQDDDATTVMKQIPLSEIVATSADNGAFLPLTVTSSLPTRVGLVTSVAGYDSARKSAVMESAAEVTVWGPLALRGGAVYSDAKNRLRPSIGGRLGLLSQQRHGIDGAVGVFYRPEGLTEGEGEIETVVSVGRRVGETLLVGNLAYGQDPEGNERDGELRAAALHRFGAMVRAGLDGRWRFDLGSNQAKLRSANEATFDLAVGPIAALALGPIHVSAQTGLSAVRFVDGPTRVGAVALGGLGTAF